MCVISHCDAKIRNFFIDQDEEDGKYDSVVFFYENEHSFTDTGFTQDSLI